MGDIFRNALCAADCGDYWGAITLLCIATGATPEQGRFVANLELDQDRNEMRFMEFLADICSDEIIAALIEVAESANLTNFGEIHAQTVDAFIEGVEAGQNHRFLYTVKCDETGNEYVYEFGAGYDPQTWERSDPSTWVVFRE